MFIKRKPKKVNDTTRLSIRLSLICCVLFTNCTYFQNKKAEKQMQNYTAYKDLHQHHGTDNYEVITLFNENTQIKEALIESKQQLLTVIGSDEKTNHSERKKISFFGKSIDKYSVFKTLNNGTIWSIQKYSNWLINADKTLYKYTNPLNNCKIDDVYNLKNNQSFENWLPKFKELYTKSSFVHIYNSRYYFNYENDWFLMDSHTEELPKNFTSQYPEKINPEEVRMQPLQESMEALMKQNIIKVIDYVQMDSEQGIGLNPINFSSGYYMLELYLPQADTLKFRRYGAMGVSSELFVYQIPEALGGSKDVFFIEQEPNSLYPNKSFAGFYAIRPKNYKQLPEYRPLLEKEKQQQLKSRRSFLPNEK